MDATAWTVNEALQAEPQLAETLNRLGIDTCGGGALTLNEAARAAGQMPGERAALEPTLEARPR
jgi:regulator of cell morphogenesis and NO signaling